jgi:hypothetical protein
MYHVLMTAKLNSLLQPEELTSLETQITLSEVCCLMTLSVAKII